MKKQLLVRSLVLVSWFLLFGAALAVFAFESRSSHVAAEMRAIEPVGLTIYLRNFDPKHISDAAIRAAIPAWERAANGRFRTVWHTPKVRIALVQHVPAGGIEADFTNRGPVQGALAYHTQNRGRPAIVVYVGADDYYGYSDSVSFTHEMFELLADEHTAAINQGWPVDNFTLDHGQFKSPTYISVPVGQLLINEVCDPVEAFHYVLHGADGKPVFISDWVTPNYFNDQQTVPAGVPQYDAMGLVQEPLTILRGGYQSLFVIDFATQTGIYTGWVSLTNFRGAGRDPGGYLDDRGGKVVAG